MMGWELVLRVGPGGGVGGVGWAASVDSVLCCVIENWAERLKNNSDDVGGKKSFFFGAFCVESLCFVLTTPPYSTSLLITPWNLVTHYALNLSLHPGTCHYVLHWRLFYWRIGAFYSSRTIHYLAQTQIICLSFFLFF